jgi:neutral ceramidase
MTFKPASHSAHRAACLFLLAICLCLSAAAENATADLKAGFAQVDITPPIGAIITGPMGPLSTATDDPLKARAMVVASGGRKLVIVGVDLVKIRRDLSDKVIELVMQQTDIKRDGILICPSHNHSGPLIPADGDNAKANKAYIDTLPKLISDSIVLANKALQPARMSVGRSIVLEGHINRRLISKSDGLVLNTWLKKVNDLKAVPQLLGSESVIDPELWLVRFDSLEGKMLGTLMNFTCHPCLHDRIKTHTWSADFPGVIADTLAKEFGPQAVGVFTQGASGNIQPPVCWAPDWKERAAVFANAAVDAAKTAVPVDAPVVDYLRRDVDVTRCNAEAQRPEAITRLGWRQESFEGAKQTAAAMPRLLNVPVSAARIGPFAIATNAGELFVEWGISVKKRSPFPHTILSELTNHWVGYEPTEMAFKHEGYETLAGANFVALEGIQTLVDTAVEMLEELWKKAPEQPQK